MNEAIKIENLTEYSSNFFLDNKEHTLISIAMGLGLILVAGIMVFVMIKETKEVWDEDVTKMTLMDKVYRVGSPVLLVLFFSLFLYGSYTTYDIYANDSRNVLAEYTKVMKDTIDSNAKQSDIVLYTLKNEQEPTVIYYDNNYYTIKDNTIYQITDELLQHPSANN